MVICLRGGWALLRLLVYLFLIDVLLAVMLCCAAVCGCCLWRCRLEFGCCV